MFQYTIFSLHIFCLSNEFSFIFIQHLVLLLKESYLTFIIP